jgi:hypothetical protein
MLTYSDMKGVLAQGVLSIRMALGKSSKLSLVNFLIRQEREVIEKIVGSSPYKQVMC